MEVTTSPSLVVAPHPILAQAGRQIYYAEFQPGESIAEYLDRQGIKLGRQPWMLMVNGQPVPREWWGRVRPKPGALITLRALVHGGGGGGKNPLQTILTIALMVMAPEMGAWMATNVYGQSMLAFGSFTWAEVWTFAIKGAGTLLISGLGDSPQQAMSQAAGNYNEGTASPTYALSGGSNRSRPYEPLPWVVGRHRHYPDYGAKYWAEFEGDDQYLYQVFNFGIGTQADLLLSDFKIGDTAISAYEGVTITEAGADGKLPGFPAVVDPTAGGAVTAEAGWVLRTGHTGATALGVDIEAQIYGLNESGITSNSVTLEMEYAPSGTGAWLPFFDAGAAVTLTNATRQPVRRTFRREVFVGQYDVRIRRTTPDSTDSKAVAETSWAVLKSYRPDDTDYTGQRRVGVKIRASGQLNGQLEQFNAIASRMVPVWTGAAWESRETSNPAWSYLAFSRGTRINGVLAVGCGLADAGIDIEGLKAWGAWCDAHGLSFDAVFDSARTRADILNLISSCGRASPTWATGKLGVVWDAEDQPHVGVFNMANMVAGSFKVRYATEKLADEIVLTFINPELGYTQDTVRVRVPGTPWPPTNPATVELFGCANLAMAGKIANLRAAAQRYHRRRVQWESDFEGLVAQRGDVVVLSHDLTQWGTSGRLVAATATQLTLDRPVSYSTASPYIGVRHPEGAYHIKAVQPFDGESDVLTLMSPLEFDDGAGGVYNAGNDPDSPVIDYTYVFEPTPTPGRRVKVTGVPKVSGGGKRIQFTARDDDPAYYAAENGAFTWTQPVRREATPRIFNLAVTEELIRAGTGYAVRLHLTWSVAGPYAVAAVSIAEAGGPMVHKGTTSASRFEILAADVGTAIDIKVVAMDGLGRFDPVGGVATTTYTVAGSAAPPGNVPWFLISGDGLRWGMRPEVDIAGYRIRWNPNASHVWATAQPLHEGLLVSSPYTMINRPTGPVTLLIKAVDTAGNESLSPAAIVTDLGDAAVGNIVDTHDWRTGGWPVAITGGAVDGASGDIVAAVDVSPVMWTNDADPMWTNDLDPMWDPSTYAALGVVASLPQLSAADAGGGITLAATVAGLAWTTEYRRSGQAPMWTRDTDPMWTNDADPMWAPPEVWKPWPGRVAAEAVAYDFRISVAPGATQGRISALSATIDVADVVESIQDVTIAAGGTRLPITRSYRAIRAVSMTLQADGGTARSIRLEDKNPTLGPLVKCLDGTGASVSGLIDVNTIQGY